MQSFESKKSKEKQEIERNPIRNEEQTENKILIEESSDDEEKKAKDLQKQQKNQTCETNHESQDILEIDDKNRQETVAKQSDGSMNSCLSEKKEGLKHMRK